MDGDVKRSSWMAMTQRRAGNLQHDTPRGSIAGRHLISFFRAQFDSDGLLEQFKQNKKHMPLPGTVVGQVGVRLAPEVRREMARLDMLRIGYERLNTHLCGSNTSRHSEMWNGAWLVALHACGSCGFAFFLRHTCAKNPLHAGAKATKNLSRGSNTHSHPIMLSCYDPRGNKKIKHHDCQQKMGWSNLQRLVFVHPGQQLPVIGPNRCPMNNFFVQFRWQS